MKTKGNEKRKPKEKPTTRKPRAAATPIKRVLSAGAKHPAPVSEETFIAMVMQNQLNMAKIGLVGLALVAFAAPQSVDAFCLMIVTLVKRFTNP